ncbi:MAG: RNA-binding transcriptional accessory protein, partial [Clostridia bacterium]|nr:RNA-binding transcriptional accessory protein [Clostridia bacterium]
MDYAKVLSKEMNIKEEYAANIISLLDDGNTIPFIARYRKEMHGSMDDQLIREFADKLEYYRNLDKRREEIRSLIEAQEKLTDEISQAIDGAETLSTLEDIYRPFKPKRKTRASIAKEKGLEPLAQLILEQRVDVLPENAAADYINAELGVEDTEQALAGASDIIAEQISDDANIRSMVRSSAAKKGVIRVKAVDSEAESVYTKYYDFSEPAAKIPNHRILAVNRGEKDGILKVVLENDDEAVLSDIHRELLHGNSKSTDIVKAACDDSYTRLIMPSIERELRNDLTDRANEDSIKVFASNLKQLLMQPPVKGKVVLGLDPGYRTGCKTAVVDGTGKVLATDVLYITHSKEQAERSEKKLLSLIDKYKVDIISIGNGTATKETESFAAEAIKKCTRKVLYMVVSEAGASV